MGSHWDNGDTNTPIKKKFPPVLSILRPHKGHEKTIKPPQERPIRFLRWYLQFCGRVYSTTPHEPRL